MTALLKIDLKARLIISIVYRILMSFYGLLILYRFESSKELPLAIIFTLLYILMFSILYSKDGIYSYLRLFADFAYIFYILNNINVDNFYCSSLIFLPILNSTNHTSNSKSILLYLIPISILIFYFHYSFFVMIPFIIFIVINFFGEVRYRYINFNESLNATLDDFLLSQESYDKPYKIYKSVIEAFNRTPLMLFVSKSIVCIRVKDSVASLVNASFFVWKFDLTDDFFKNIENGKWNIFNTGLNVNGTLYNTNVCFTYDVKGTKYCYFIIPTKKNFYLVKNSLLPFFWELVSPFFIRLSKIFESYSERKKIEIDKIMEMEKKVTYVQNAISTMHFIRNKLGPLNNYLEMVKDYNSETDEKKKVLKFYIDNERDRLANSIETILNKSSYILDKANNPFRVNDLHVYNSRKLYTEIKRVWESYFDSFRPEIAINLNKDDYNIKFNTLGFELVLVNWLNNMKSYGTGYNSVSFLETDQFLIINFQNSIFDLVRAREVVDVFNSIERIEILKRNTHGLIEIIEFLTQMNISYKAKLEEKILNLDLKFIKQKI